MLSVLMFLAYLALTILLYLWRADLIDESAIESSTGYYPRKSTGFLANSTFTSPDGSVIPNKYDTHHDDGEEFHGISDFVSSVYDPEPSFSDCVASSDGHPVTADL